MTAPALVTRRELADRLGCHMQTVTKYERAGMPIAQRGNRGKPSLYDEAGVRGWLAQRADVAQAPVVSIALADVRAALSDEIAAVRAILLRSYTTRADQVQRAATAAGAAGVARELQAITYDVLRTLASPERGVRPAGQLSPVVDALRQARGLYAPPPHLIVAPPVAAVESAPPPSAPLGRRVVRSSYLGR